MILSKNNYNKNTLQNKIVLITGGGDGSVDFFQIDLADEKQIDKLYEYTMDKYTRLDVLINNAAVVPMGAIEEVSISDWDLSYAVNLRAPVLLTKKFLFSMRSTGGILQYSMGRN